MRTIQPSFSGGEISPGLGGRVDLAKYNTSLETCRNTIVHAHGGISNRPGTMLVTESVGAKPKLIPFQFNVEQSYMLEFGHRTMRIILGGGLVVDSKGAPVQIETPYDESDLPLLKYAQSADMIFFAHADYPPHALTRTSHTDWIFEELSFTPTIAPPTGFSGSFVSASSTRSTSSGTSGETSTTNTTTQQPTPPNYPISYKVSAVNEDGEESLPSSAATVTAYPSSGWEAGAFVSLSWGAVDGAKRYNVYKNSNGYYGWIGSVESTSFKDDNIEAKVDDGPQGEFSGFAEEGQYPSAVSFFQQRLVYGATNTQPQTVFGSQTGIFKNFSKSSPLKDTDAFEATIAATQVNQIRYFVPLNKMVVLTSGGEWVMKSGSDSDALSPTSIQFDPQEYRGVANVPPVVIGQTVLFVQRGGGVVRDLAFKLTDDAYVGSDLTVLADHLFEGHSIVNWAYQQDPYSIVWCVRDDGLLLGFTYLKEHEVWAWHRHDTDGLFLDVAVLEGDDADEAYFVVEREVDGQTKTYIEKLADRLPGGDLRRAWFVDSGLHYDGEPRTVFTGLDHLKGSEVAIIADGNVQANQVVADDGSVELSTPASLVTIGLPFVSDVKTLRIDIADAQTWQGTMKNIPSVTLRFHNSRGGQVGPDSENLVAVKNQLPDFFGEVPPLFSDDYEVVLMSEWNTKGSIFFRQDQPLPFTLLAIIPEVTIGG